MKANGTWTQKINGVSITITVKGGYASYVIEGGHEGGGTCENLGDLLCVIANAFDHKNSTIS